MLKLNIKIKRMQTRLSARKELGKKIIKIEVKKN